MCGASENSHCNLIIKWSLERRGALELSLGVLINKISLSSIIVLYVAFHPFVDLSKLPKTFSIEKMSPKHTQKV